MEDEGTGVTRACMQIQKTRIPSKSYGHTSGGLPLRLFSLDVAVDELELMQVLDGLGDLQQDLKDRWGQVRLMS